MFHFLKKFLFRPLSLLLVLCFLISTVFPGANAFTDVHPHQGIYKAVEHFLETGALEDRGSFSGDQEITKGLFWKLVMSELGVTDESPVGTLPTGVSESSMYAPYLSAAVEKDLIEARVPFDERGSVREGEAVKAILESKGIEVPLRVSPSFRNQVTGISRHSNYLRFLEAAHASNILEEADFQPFGPYKKLTRRKTVQWLYNFVSGGEVKESTVNPDRYSTQNPNRRLMRVRSTGRTSSSSEKTEEKTLAVPDGKVLEQVYAQILNHYRFSEEVTEAKKRDMINAAIAAMVEEVGDKYSSYIEPKDVEKFQSSLNGDFEGIGAFVDIIDSKFTIVSPIKGSPAEEAGLLPSDVVTHVNGEDISGKPINEVTSKIKGEAGTPVTLTIWRENRAFDVEVTRGKIKIPAINLEWEKSIPILGVHQFNRDTGVKLREIIETEILPKNPKGLILDLRNNPGGYLVAAVQVGEIFLDEGQEVFSVEYKTNKQTYKSSRQGPLVHMDNIVVLQNKGSASASEIVAAMLQDYGKATIMGTKSLGKGTVQNINNYDNGGLLKLTVAKWLSPKGRWIHESGVIPDVETEDQTVEQRREDVDPPLEKAIQHVLGNR